MVLSQLGKGSIDHPISFDNRKLSVVENNYTTTKRKGLDMVYALHKFIHYLLGGLVIMYESNFFKHLGKLKIHWLGPYIFEEITDEGALKL